MQNLLSQIKKCTICEPHLDLGANPVVTGHINSKIVIIGQAPGTKVHKSGIPWDDASGKKLRKWLAVTESAFYNPSNFAIIPMGFCYPGKGKSGDLPPRPECAPQWHKILFEQIDSIQLMILIGTYAQHYYLKDSMKKNLTDTVLHFKTYY